MAPRGFSRVAGIAVVLAALALASTGPHASAAGAPIKPHQYFVGLVNGSAGRPNAAVIRMACFGALTPGETGHPMSGQTIAAQRVPPSSHAGLTGPSTASIGAFFGAPPPSASSSASYVDFTRYGQQALPTSLTLPCSGGGDVNFVPLPTVAGGRSFTVPVTFVGQP